MARELTEKQRRFVEAYMGEARGNATQAARMAGYSGNDNTLQTVGNDNLRKPAIAKAIEERRNECPLIASREEILAFYTSVVRDESEATRERIKAADSLTKACGGFVKKVEHSGEIGTGEVIIFEMPKSPRDRDDE